MRVKLKNKNMDKFDKNIVRTKGRDLIPVPMSNQRLKELSIQLTKTHKAMTDFEDDYREFKKKSRIALKQYKIKVKKLMEKLSSGAEFEVKDIIIEKDFGQKVVRRFYQNQLIDQRPMEKDDYQLDIFEEKIEKNRIDLKKEIHDKIESSQGQNNHAPLPHEIKRGLEILNKIAVDVDG